MKLGVTTVPENEQPANHDLRTSPTRPPSDLAFETVPVTVQSSTLMPQPMPTSPPAHWYAEIVSAFTVEFEMTTFTVPAGAFVQASVSLSTQPTRPPA